MKPEIKKYCEKPVDNVDAFRWFKEMGEVKGIVVRNPTGHPQMPDSYYLDTPNGYLSIQDGNWVIKRYGVHSLLSNKKFKERFSEVIIK